MRKNDRVVVLSENGSYTNYNKKEHPILAHRLALLGVSIRDMANVFGVAHGTLDFWMKNYSDFNEAINSGRFIADSLVAEKLYERATGTTRTKEVISKTGEIVELSEEVLPDVAAQQYWLERRQRNQWGKNEVVTLKGDSESPLEFILAAIAEEENEASPLPAALPNEYGDDD
ncbi:hypothetical protein [Photobacterium angustum]|uniref:hypothetical protein n=1 Tax=Photobacterium angustum TaxID=661 RepID=UPI0005EB6DFF|nr:hypothetical protein [Photobacterium angustum]PSV61686.1 hypothetical protein CTM95_20505 [Photobacterium angustum]